MMILDGCKNTVMLEKGHKSSKIGKYSRRWMVEEGKLEMEEQNRQILKKGDIMRNMQPAFHQIIVNTFILSNISKSSMFGSHNGRKDKTGASKD